MILDWRAAVGSLELQWDLMLAETAEQLFRDVGQSRPVLLLRDAVREAPNIADEVLRELERLLSTSADAEALALSIMPICCYVYVLSGLGVPQARAAVEDLSARSDPGLRWAPRFARVCLTRFVGSSVPSNPEVAAQHGASLDVVPLPYRSWASASGEDVEWSLADVLLKPAA